MALCEPVATLIPQPNSARLFQAAGIALLFTDSTLSATGSEDNAIEKEGRTSNVARRRPDGSWLFVIDAPYGADHGVG